ncbi:hypothetical protein IAT38_003789 [Cryptococcus sp. DSM 104549]
MRSLISLPRVRLSRFLPIFFLLSISIITYLALSARRPPASLVPFADLIPLITLIIVYDGVKLPSFSPYFFDSVERQGHALELLLVQRRGCSDLTQHTRGHGNIKHVCLSEDKFWGAHRDYLCKRWGGCTRAQSNLMLGDMVTLGRLAMPQAVYPTLRGWVFRKYMNPRTAYWGYCDMDIFLGDLSQNFPYDLAAQNDYDVFIPTEPSEMGGNRLLFMRGHLTFFRNSKVTENRLLRYEYFRSFEAWDEMTRLSMSVGEGEQSHFVVGDPKVNLLAFDGLAPAPLIRSSSLAGVVSLPDSLRPASGTPILPPHVIRQLMTPALHLPTRPSFSDDGLVFPMSITQGEAPPGYGIWFPERFCSWYVAEPQPKETHGAIGGAGRQRWRRYVMKLNNQWTERLEPMREFRGHFKDGGMDGAHQWLYAHWQEEKKKSYFRDLPTHISPGDIFVSYFYDGNAAFDAKTGKRLFWLARREEDCGHMGCVEPGETPVHERKTYEHFTSTQSAFAGWYEHSKKVRQGFATGTAGPDPSE